LKFWKMHITELQRFDNLLFKSGAAA